MEEGKIDSDKAAELIEALNSVPETQQLPKSINSDKMLRVRVQSGTDDNVNINVPVSFLKAIGTAVNNVKIHGLTDQVGLTSK
jgi:hypothetical protein